MQIANYLKMNSEELDAEILKQKKKIKMAKETIQLLEKLKLANSVSNQNEYRGIE